MRILFILPFLLIGIVSAPAQSFNITENIELNFWTGNFDSLLVVQIKNWSDSTVLLVSEDQFDFEHEGQLYLDIRIESNGVYSPHSPGFGQIISFRRIDKEEDEVRMMILPKSFSSREVHIWLDYIEVPRNEGLCDESLYQEYIEIRKLFGWQPKSLDIHIKIGEDGLVDLLGIQVRD